MTGEQVDGEILTSGQFFVAVSGLAAMRRILTAPSAVRPRLDEVREIVGRLDEAPYDIEIPIVEHDVDGAYSLWADSYDGPNPAIAAEEPVVHGILARLPTGRALDAACGTGRHAAHLVAAGWDVVGVDATTAMLDRARAKVPDARFEAGDLTALPLDDAAFDLVVCSLALTHVVDLAGAVAEMARVVRPGGTVVLSDLHPTTVLVGGTAAFPHGTGLAHVRNLHHPVSSYLRAARAAGLEVVDCAEPVMDDAVISGHLAHPFVPDAVRQAYEGLPFLVVWHLRRPG